MHDIELRGTWHDPEQAGRHFAETVRPWCREQWAAGRRLTVTITELQDDRSLRQNAFMWGFVLKTISEQAQVEGIGAPADGWHRYYKVMFLGYLVRKVKVPGKKRPSITRELRSTTKLSVSRMSKYLDQVMAHAATTFGVTFEAGKRWEDWRV